MKKFNEKIPKKMLKKAVDGFIYDEIYVNIGISYDFIEGCCSSLHRPDFAYKRFPCDYNGYKKAHDWVIARGKNMYENRLSQKYPSCWDWTEENIKNEPLALIVELDIEDNL